MKRVIVAAVLALATAGVLGGGANASGDLVYEASGFTCGVYDFDRILRFTTDSYLAVYSSGRVYLRCEAQGSNSSGIQGTGNYSKTGFTCNTIFGPQPSLTWQTRHSTLGRAQLTCFNWVNNPNEIARLSAAIVAGQ